MVHDHEAIVARIDRLAGTDLEDVDTVQELLYGLYALIGVHFRKEEDLQLPAFDAAREVTEAVLERMGALAGHPHTHVARRVRFTSRVRSRRAVCPPNRSPRKSEQRLGQVEAAGIEPASEVTP